MTDTAQQIAPYIHKEGAWMSRSELYDNFRELGGFKEYFYDWGGLNKWLFMKINGIRDGSYDQLMLAISDLAKYKLFPYYFAVILGVFLVSLIVRKVRKKGAMKQTSIKWFAVFAVLIVGFVANGVVTRVAKDVFSFPRPYVELAKSDINLLEVEEGADDGHRSFPSGHVAFITFLMISLWPLFGKNMRIASLFIIALVGWSRISVGMHYPADVVGGFIISSCVVILVRMLVYFLFRKFLRITC